MTGCQKFQVTHSTGKEGGFSTYARAARWAQHNVKGAFVVEVEPGSGCC